ncbi:hypothetical protein CKM354_000407400 [Cercospora kikuchii]|uniref:Uncharacterized protein n=1 Tax=Cercospora kikuchii TaxID=84275 RepID=A0A9P3CG50_9PEZI|nr:uncharacterized protein CKM354_000407400 [Cercospora kikuchii]GIZ40747.1 hypothetical protein CKM354_000407400 [Cercospora kikuchii]
MGNCCGKSSDENFQGEGRTLGAAPVNAPIPSNNARAAAPPKVTGPGRTLGNASGEQQPPGSAAARAAEERAKAAQGKGKLGKQLDAQKSQTQKDTLAQTARDNVAARDADAAAQARAYN